jgi:hypothetical protein
MDKQFIPMDGRQENYGQPSIEITPEAPEISPRRNLSKRGKKH